MGIGVYWLITRKFLGREWQEDTPDFRPDFGVRKMPMHPTPRDSNRLLASLAEADRELIEPFLRRVKLEFNETLVASDEAIKFAYFPEGGIISVVSESSEEPSVEVGIIGREGMSGFPVLLGARTSPNRTFVQVDGSSAQRIAVPDLLRLVAESEAMRGIFLKFVHSFMIQAGCSTVAAAHYKTEARLARWLLMCFDRTDGTMVKLTHEFMAVMVAVQRTTVTMTLHILESTGAIKARRGQVLLLDRALLEELAGESYGLPEREYRKLFSEAA